MDNRTPPKGGCLCLSVCMGPIDPLKNFFQKNPLTPPLSSHTVSYKMEKEPNSA